MHIMTTTSACHCLFCRNCSTSRVTNNPTNLHITTPKLHTLTSQMRSCRPCRLVYCPCVADSIASKPTTPQRPRRTVSETAGQPIHTFAELWSTKADRAEDVVCTAFQTESAPAQHPLRSASSQQSVPR